VSVLVAVLISATTFALMHGNIVQIAATLPLAVLLALVYERTRSLWPCVLAHVGFNLAATLIPVRVLLIWANPFSIGLFMVAFLVCAWMIYQRVTRPVQAGPATEAAGAGAEHLGSAEGEKDDPRAASGPPAIRVIGARWCAGVCDFPAWGRGGRCVGACPCGDRVVRSPGVGLKVIHQTYSCEEGRDPSWPPSVPASTTATAGSSGPATPTSLVPRTRST